MKLFLQPESNRRSSAKTGNLPTTGCIYRALRLKLSTESEHEEKFMLVWEISSCFPVQEEMTELGHEYLQLT